MATGWNLQQVSWWKSQKVKTKTKVFPWLFSNTRYGYGAEHILSMRVVLADGRIAEVTPEKTKVSQSRSSGKNFPSRFSSHGQARCSTRRTITSSLRWEELDPAMELSHNSGISYAASAYIWTQDSTKKKNFTEWTCLRYIVYKAPETEPAILLARADTSNDLVALKAAGQVLKALAGQGPRLIHSQ